MKEITLKEWSAYLPYGLICEVKDQGEIKTDTLSGIYDNKELVFHNIVESHQGFESVKPILYDLSWLTREIEFGGEKFIPNHDPLFKYFIPYELEEFKNSIPYSLSFEQYEKLLEWKFNVFNLPDELIVRVTEDFNPYK
jgi:hypothetical protein